MAIRDFFGLLVYAPVGGFQVVTDAIERLAIDLGVQIEKNVTVIRVQNNGVRVLKDSVEEFVPADLVVVNADLPYASKSILDRDIGSRGKASAIFDWDDSFSFSSGVISFHWSVKKELNVLNTHNVFLSAKSRTQAEASWAILRDNRGDVQPDTPFNFYVHRASQTDPTAAPAGCDSIMVLVPCRTLARVEEYAQLPREEALERYKNQFSESVIDQARQAVFARMNVLESLQNFEEFILDEVVDTPATWAEQFHVAAGTPFGLVCTSCTGWMNLNPSLLLRILADTATTPPPPPYIESRICSIKSDKTKSLRRIKSKPFVLRCQHPTWEWSPFGINWRKASGRKGRQTPPRTHRN